MKILILLINLLFVSALSNTGDYYLKKGLENKNNLEFARENFELAKIEFEKENNVEGLINSIYYIAYTYELESNYKECIYYYQKALKIAEDNDDFKLQYTVNNRLNLSYKDVNLFSLSKFHLNNNKHLFDLNVIDTTLYDNYLYNLANYYYSIKQFDKSIYNLIKIDSSNISKIKNLYFNLLGLNYFSIKNYKKAYKYFYEGIEHYPKDKLLHTNITKMFFEKGEVDSALKYFNIFKSLELENDGVLAKNINRLLESEMLFYQSKYDKVENILNNIIPYFSENKIYDRLIESYVFLIEVNNKTNKGHHNDSITKLLLEANDEKFKKQSELTASILNSMNELRLENSKIEEEKAQYRLFLIFSIVLICVLIFTSYLFYRYRQVKIKFEGDSIDYHVKLYKIQNYLNYNLKTHLSRASHKLLERFDFAEIKDIYQDIDDAVKTKNEMEDVITKNPIESPFNLEPKTKTKFFKLSNDSKFENN